MLYQITSSYFCAGIETEYNIVTETAPILSYMKGWKLNRVTQYCMSKGWKFYSLKSADIEG
jgi:hypothetical protein